jgi:hypothetical protein
MDASVRVVVGPLLVSAKLSPYAMVTEIAIAKNHGNIHHTARATAFNIAYLACWRPVSRQAITLNTQTCRVSCIVRAVRLGLRLARVLCCATGSSFSCG